MLVAEFITTRQAGTGEGEDQHRSPHPQVCLSQPGIGVIRIIRSLRDDCLFSLFGCNRDMDR